MRLKYQTITFSQQNCEVFTCDSLPISYDVNKIWHFWCKDSYREMNLDNISNLKIFDITQHYVYTLLLIPAAHVLPIKVLQVV